MCGYTRAYLKASPMPPVPLRCFFCFVVVGLVPVCSFVVTRSTIRSEFCVDIVSFSDPNVLFGMLVASDLAPCRTNERFRGTLGAHEWIPLGSRFAWAATARVANRGESVAVLTLLCSEVIFQTGFGSSDAVAH